VLLCWIRFCDQITLAKTLLQSTTRLCNVYHFTSAPELADGLICDSTRQPPTLEVFVNASFAPPSGHYLWYYPITPIIAASLLSKPIVVLRHVTTKWGKLTHKRNGAHGWLAGSVNGNNIKPKKILGVFRWP